MDSTKLNRINRRIDKLEEVERKTTEVVTGLHDTDRVTISGLGRVVSALNKLYTSHECSMADDSCAVCAMKTELDKELP